MNQGELINSNLPFSCLTNKSIFQENLDLPKFSLPVDFSNSSLNNIILNDSSYLKTSTTDMSIDECYSSFTTSRSGSSTDSFANSRCPSEIHYENMDPTKNFGEIITNETLKSDSLSDECYSSSKSYQSESSNRDFTTSCISLTEEKNNEDLDQQNDKHDSVFSMYNIRPVSVKCLQSVKELHNTCEKLGLTLCSSDSTINVKAFKYNHFLYQCAVQGLYPYEKLKLLSKKSNLKFNNGKFNGTKRKVDLILEHENTKGTQFYLIKWKYLPSKRNSWVSKSFLLPNYDAEIRYYHKIHHIYSEISIDLVKTFYHDLVTRKPRDYLTLVKLCALVLNSSEQVIKELSLNFQELKMKAKVILETPLLRLKKLQSQLFELMQFSHQRKRSLINLKEWERDINNFNPATYIEVENNVDLEMAPTNFQFIHDYVRNQEYVEEPVCFCECDNCYDNRKHCCPHDSDGAFPYSKYGRLQLLPGYPIYECNKLCKCGDDCVNRVVQHGQKVKVAIFRTSNGCGWGLKALEVIQKDQFVLEYLGEIITSDEAEARGETYDFIGRTYLFDLDYGEGNCLYTVDAGHMGNAGHFINHSCDPNLHVFAVWINQPDPNLPRLALFAKRKINRGEELTFDYKMVKNRDGFGAMSSPPVGIECKCNSKNCRKYLF